jgi:uncharacterized protein (UPF0332 family)
VAVEEATVLIKAGHHIGSVDRLHYACFYAVTALLNSEGLSAPNHATAITQFNRHWVKTNRLPKEMGVFFRNMFDRMVKADYGERIEFTTAEVETWFAETRQFVNIIKNYLNEH